MDPVNQTSPFAPPATSSQPTVPPIVPPQQSASAQMQPQKPTTLPPLPSEVAKKPVDTVTITTTPLSDTPKKKGFTGTLVKLGLSILFIAAIAIPVGYIIQSNLTSQQKGNDTKITVDTKNTDVKDALTKQLVYAGTGDKEYYSPTLDASFTYSSDKFTLSEGTKSLLILPYNNYDISATLELLRPTNGTAITDPSAYFAAYYKALYTNAKIGDKVAKDGITTVTITYDINSLTETGKKTTIVLTLLYRIDKDTTIAMIIKQDAGATLSDQVLSSLTDIIKTVKVSPTGIDANIAIKLVDPAISFQFDRKKWTVNAQSATSASISLVTASYKEPDIKIRVDATEFKGFKDDKTIQDRSQKDFDYDKDAYKANSFTSISAVTKTKIGTVDFYMYKVSYTSGSYKYTKTAYTGFAVNTSYITTITITKLDDPVQKNSPTFGDADIQKVLDTLKFDLPKTSAVTSTKLASASIDPISAQAAQVLGESAITIEKSALLGKNATVRIFSRLCSDVKVSMPDLLPISSKKTYQICTAGLGTGFYVNTDGYIVTNAHVASPNAFDSTMEALRSGNDAGLFSDIQRDIIVLYLEKYPFADPTDPVVKKDITDLTLAAFAKGVIENKITATRSAADSELYVEGDKPFDVDLEKLKIKTPADYIKVEIVDAKQLESEYKFSFEQAQKAAKDRQQFTINVPDLAILKVSSPEGKYPALSLATAQTFSVGTQIYAIGFPGLANSKTLFSDTAARIATITKGTISAIKPSANNNFSLIQIDATISHGNSGGPIINTDGKVIAVSTYGISGTSEKDYNAGVSAEEVQKYLAQESITNTPGTITTALESGLDNMSREYYNWAIRDFTKVKTEYAPASSVVTPLIALAQEKVDKGLDNTPIFEISGYFIHQKDLPLLGGVVGVIILLIIIIIVLSALRASKKKEALKPAPTETIPPMPQQTSVKSAVQVNPSGVSQNAVPVSQPQPMPQMPATTPTIPVKPVVPVTQSVTAPVTSQYAPPAPAEVKPPVVQASPAVVAAPVPTPATVQNTAPTPITSSTNLPPLPQKQNPFTQQMPVAPTPSVPPITQAPVPPISSTPAPAVSVPSGFAQNMPTPPMPVTQPAPVTQTPASNPMPTATPVAAPVTPAPTSINGPQLP